MSRTVQYSPVGAVGTEMETETEAETAMMDCLGLYLSTERFAFSCTCTSACVVNHGCSTTAVKAMEASVGWWGVGYTVEYSECRVNTVIPWYTILGRRGRVVWSSTVLYCLLAYLDYKSGVREREQASASSRLILLVRTLLYRQ